MASEYGISVASRPSTPCMATRLPYNTRIDYDVLDRIAQGEAYLRDVLPGNVRLRLHGGIARLEVDNEAFARLLDRRADVVRQLKGCLLYTSRSHCVCRQFHRQYTVWRSGPQNQKKEGRVMGWFTAWNRRKTLFIFLIMAALMLTVITIGGRVLENEAMVTDFSRKNLAPCPAYPFGTDWMGRDMFVRTITGLSLSIRIGLLTAAVSALIACFMGTAAACLGKAADGLVGIVIDLVMGIPHILSLIHI